MYNATYDELNTLLLEGNKARAYAWNHYEALNARECVYRLYGPYSGGLGAGMPGSLTSKRARQLSKQTRRKDHLIYELDADFKLIRVISIRDYTKIEMIYHCFENLGTLYAIPFRGTNRELSSCQSIVIKYYNNTPSYLGFVSGTSGAHLLAHFYEYPSNETAHVTCYGYSPNAQFTVHGYPVDKTSPVGSLSSPAERGAWEEDIRHTDFSQWFKEQIRISRLGEHSN